MNQGEDVSVAKDPFFQTQFGNNINSYLKSDQFAKTKEFSPGLWHWLSMVQAMMSYPMGNVPLEQRIVEVMKNSALPAASL